VARVPQVGTPVADFTSSWTTKPASLDKTVEHAKNRHQQKWISVFVESNNSVIAFRNKIRNVLFFFLQPELTVE
jgi:hypothetical protein